MSFIRGTISRLKRRFGASIQVYKTISRTHNLDTGKDIVDRQVVTIPKAIVFPPQLQFQLSPAGAFNTVKVGGLLQSDVTTALIDARDLKGMELNTEDCQVVHKKERYEISKVENYNDEAFLLSMKAIRGVPLELIYEPKLSDKVLFSEGYQ